MKTHGTTGRRVKRISGLPEPERNLIDIIKEMKNRQDVLEILLDANLEPLENWVIRHRYGLFGAKRMKFEAMSQMADICVNDLKEIKARAMHKIIAAARPQMRQENIQPG
ncbi:MAG: hypothetical protein ABR875_03795 [Minisyncoccia bacterium]